MKKRLIFAFILVLASGVYCRSSLHQPIYAGINDNLVSYWKFDEGLSASCAGGEDLCDAEGSNHGTRDGSGGDNNLPQWNDTVKPDIAADNPYAMNFDGSDDRVTSIGDLNFSSNEFSVTAWIRPEAWGEAADAYIHNLLCDETVSDSTFCFRIGSQGNATISFQYSLFFL
jgi:hypothetical protein